MKSIHSLRFVRLLESPETFTVVLESARNLLRLSNNNNNVFLKTAGLSFLELFCMGLCF